MLGRRLLPVGFAAAALTLTLFGSRKATCTQTRPDADEIIRLWASGPARYLMTWREDETLRSIRSIPQLARFITAFWERRDPTPGTVENEFRRTYWKRVLEADRRYRDSTTPGWKTDRGKVFVLLGPPDEVETDESPGFGTKNADGDPLGIVRGLERWSYTRRGSRATSSEFIVAFVRDSSLDWKLSGDPRLIKPDFPGTVTSDAGDHRFGGIEGTIIAAPGGGPQAEIDRRFPEIDTSLFANYDLGLELAVPSTPEIMIATVTAQEFLSAFSATPRFEFFRAEDGSTFVNVGALFKKEDLYPPGTTGSSKLRLYVRAMPKDGVGSPRYAANDAQPPTVEPAKGAPPGGLFDVWAGLALEPGRYFVTLAIEDSSSARVGRAATELEVPDLSRPGLTLSTLVLASDLSDTGGRLSFTTRSSGTFRRSESLGIYYEVYGLPGETSDGFHTSYRFFREKPDGAVMPIADPIVFAERVGAAQGWSFPLAKWPVGRYRMDVTVTGADNVSVSSQVSFQVVD